MAPKSSVDWEAIEREYRAGQLSLREIGRTYGVTDTRDPQEGQGGGMGTRSCREGEGKRSASDWFAPMVRSNHVREPTATRSRPLRFAGSRSSRRIVAISNSCMG